MTFRFFVGLIIVVLMGAAGALWAHSYEPQLDATAKKNSRGWAGTLALIAFLIIVAVVA